jgi:hypothetical protein
MTATQVARALAALEPAGAVQAARYELAMDFLADLRRIDTQMREAKKRLEVAVKASGTTLTEVFGVGPYVAGTVPIEVSSGGHKVFRLSRRGNRRLNHAVHMAAVTQVAHRHSEGRVYYDRKIKEGKSNKEALRCLKRRISDAIFAHLVADAKRRAQSGQAGPGGQRGNGSVSSVARSHPERQLFGQATPRPVSTIRRTVTSRGSKSQEAIGKKTRKVS